MLSPLKVHPDFRDLVLEEVEKQGGRPALERWIQILRMENGK